MQSTTYRLAKYTLVLSASCLVALFALPIVWPAESLGVAAQALSTMAVAFAGGGSAVTAAFGIRHYGTQAPTSEMIRNTSVDAEV